VLRLVELFLPEESKGPIETVLDEQPTLARWNSTLEEGRVRVTVLLGGDATEETIQALEDRVREISDARIILLAVEATVPRPEEIAEEEAESDGPVAFGEEPEEPEVTFGSTRLSTAELYQEVLEMSETTAAYVGLILLSTLVAALGMWDGSIIAIIGAMVIAPLIGPNVGLCLATTLADGDLAKKSMLTSIVGVTVAFVASYLLGLWLPLDPATGEIAGRTLLGPEDIGLALAAGGAAVLSLTVGVSTALVGVMVAVALLPPLVASGLLLGSGYLADAIGAALLVSSNVICINLAGVVAFLVQGVRPHRYWEAEEAKRSTAVAIALWITMLAALAVIIWQAPGDAVSELFKP